MTVFSPLGLLGIPQTPKLVATTPLGEELINALNRVDLHREDSDASAALRSSELRAAFL